MVRENGTLAYGNDFNYELQKDYAPLFTGSYSYGGAGGGQSCGLLYFAGYSSPWSDSSSYCSARTMIVPN